MNLALFANKKNKQQKEKEDEFNHKKEEVREKAIEKAERS
jgi:hypothetical protein